MQLFFLPALPKETFAVTCHTLHGLSQIYKARPSHLKKSTSGIFFDHCIEEQRTETASFSSPNSNKEGGASLRSSNEIRRTHDYGIELYDLLEKPPQPYATSALPPCELNMIPLRADKSQRYTQDA